MIQATPASTLAQPLSLRFPLSDQLRQDLVTAVAGMLREAVAGRPAVCPVELKEVSDHVVGGAFVTLKPGASSVTDADIIRWCRDNLARYKVPKHVVFGPLPKTSTGKIQKYALREKAKTA